MKREIHETCSPNEKLCGISLDSSFCIPQASTCPINSLRFIRVDEEPLEGEERIEMFDSYHSLVFSRSNPDSLPISDFRLTEGSVCADKQQYARSEGKPVYSLEVVEKGVDECT